jgi:hypothetical protein
MKPNEMKAFSTEKHCKQKPLKFLILRKGREEPTRENQKNIKEREKKECVCVCVCVYMCGWEK